MKRGIARKVALGLALAATAFLCHASERLRDLSTRSLALGRGPEPVPLSELARWSVGLGGPPSLDSCMNRLRQIDGATQEWALEHNVTKDAPVTWQDIAPYLHTDGLWCPNGGAYHLSTVNQHPTCSFRGHALPPDVPIDSK